MDEIIRALFKLDDFCDDNSIAYVVTGTTALAILGTPVKYAPSDIDIKAYNLTPCIEQKLAELQHLSGLETAHYKDGKNCYAFIVNGNVKVNVIDCSNEAARCANESITIQLYDDSISYVSKEVRVQLMYAALADKMALNREKDKTYILDLLGNIAIIGK